MQLRTLSANQRGFTLIELLVVIGIITVLFGLASVNLVRPQNIASVQGATDTLVADIKNQQLLSMTGEDGQTATIQPHGIYMTGTKYSLFAGSAYSAADSNNFDVVLDAGLALTTSFASSQVVFTKGTGAVQSYSGTNNTIAVTNSASGDQKTITITRYGAVTIN